MESKNKPTLYWSLLAFKDWNLYIASTTKGLCYVGSQNKPFEKLSEWAKKRFPGSLLIEDSEKLERYQVEIMEYLEGKRKTFTILIVDLVSEVLFRARYRHPLIFIFFYTPIKSIWL